MMKQAIVAAALGAALLASAPAVAEGGVTYHGGQVGGLLSGPDASENLLALGSLLGAARTRMDICSPEEFTPKQRVALLNAILKTVMVSARADPKVAVMLVTDFARIAYNYHVPNNLCAPLPAPKGEAS